MGDAGGVTTTVYTDGACIGNPGPGGWAWAVPDGPYASGAESQTTNQRMEVSAAFNALETLSGPVEIVSDSRYVVDCFNKRWYVNWVAKGWKNSQRQPVANQDLWKPMVEIFQRRGHELTFTWVKGHANDHWNDVVDRLATEAAAKQVGRRGDEPPTELGEADDPAGFTPTGAGSPATARAALKTAAPAPPDGAEASAGGAANRAKDPPGFRVVVLGHRPPELGGYGETLVASDVRRRLTEALTGLRALHPDLVVLTGLGLGTEQLGAEAATAAGVPYLAVLPFPDPDEKWPASSRAAYRDLLAGAADTKLVSPRKPDSRQAAGMALGKRDAWLLPRADVALVVWDGRDPGLRSAVRTLEGRIPDDVWILPPQP